MGMARHGILGKAEIGTPYPARSAARPLGSGGLTFVQNNCIYNSCIVKYCGFPKRDQARREALGRRRRKMDFGYFTLSDNHYENNKRSANQFIEDITAEALYAEQVGMHSAWIGEHHFNSLGVLSSPDLILAYIAARTHRIRLAPAVTVLPLHHPIRGAEQWATLDLLSNARGAFCCGRGLRQTRVSAIPCLVRGQPVHFRGRA